jgi:hypothetical protein
MELLTLTSPAKYVTKGAIKTSRQLISSNNNAIGFLTGSSLTSPNLGERVEKLAVRIVLLSPCLIRHGFSSPFQKLLCCWIGIFFTDCFTVTIRKIKPFLFFAVHAHCSQM